jgi:phosphoglycerate kinase
MNLPSVQNQEVSGKKVLVRADLDVSEGEDYRLEALIPTLKLLSEKEAAITLIGHRGRPGGVQDNSLSLKPVEQRLRQKAQGIAFTIMENLRFDLGEEANDIDFARRLSEGQDLYVNEAFAASHREHASIVGLAKLLPHAAGLRFARELENLSKVFENPKRPVVVIIGGAKEDKLAYIEPFKSFADKIHVVGALPKFMEASNDAKVMVANLLPDKEDITVHSIEAIEADVASAGTIILSGPIGKFEEEGHRLGTKRVLEAVSKSDAFKIAGGGDTEVAIADLGVVEGFSWISVGGGAMLEFLAKRTLPGIEALLL